MVSSRSGLPSSPVGSIVGLLDCSLSFLCSGSLVVHRKHSNPAGRELGADAVPVVVLPGGRHGAMITGAIFVLVTRMIATDTIKAALDEGHGLARVEARVVAIEVLSECLASFGAYIIAFNVESLLGHAAVGR